MAQITEVKLLDDLDGGEAAEAVSFSLDGKSYEIDLSEKHAAAPRDAFAPFVSRARRAGAAPAAGVAGRGGCAGRGCPRGRVARVRRPRRSGSGQVRTVWRCRR